MVKSVHGTEFGLHGGLLAGWSGEFESILYDPITAVDIRYYCISVCCTLVFRSFALQAKTQVRLLSEINCSSLSCVPFNGYSSSV